MTSTALPIPDVDLNKEPPSSPSKEDKTGKMKGSGKDKKVTDAKGGCTTSSVCNGIKIAAVILAIIGIVAGVIGLLVYLDTLAIGLTNIGSMSSTTGLYVMLGGFGVTFITGILLGVACIVQRAKEKNPADPSKPAKDGDKKAGCLSNLCGSDKPANTKKKPEGTKA